MTPRKRPFHFDDRVEHTSLLLVEGIEDARFFTAIAHRLNRTDLQIVTVGGKDNFRSFLVSTLMKSDNFSRLRRLGIVRDADNSAQSALQSLHDALGHAQLPAPSQAWVAEQSGHLTVSLAILPDGSSQGNLEDLCLRSIENSPDSTCVDQYVECRVSAGAQIANNRLAKSKVHAFLAVGRDTADPGLRLGEAAEAGVWDWNSPAFQPIIDFLQNL